MLRQIRDKMILIFGRTYGLYTLIIINGVIYSLLSIGYENNTVRFMQLVLSFICIIAGICGLLKSYKHNKKA